MGGRWPALLIAGLAGCAVVPPAAEPVASTGRDMQPAGARLAEVEADLLATARERFGQAALDRALGAQTYLIVKRFVGFPPPPPPGAPPDWRPTPAAGMLIKEGQQWLVATAEGWRQAQPEAAARLDALLASQAFWNEPALIPACPDYGSANLLLKAPRHARAVRSALCLGRTDEAVSAALNA
jgi:hypothetical protein